MLTILMVCTGNTCRSPMAEAMLRNLLSEAGARDVAVRSAGLYAHPDAPMSCGTQDELDRRHIPYFRTRSVRLTREMTQGALVLCMTGRLARDVMRQFPGTRVMTLNECANLNGDIVDPYGGGDIAYRRAGEQIERAVSVIAQKILNSELEDT